MKILVITIKRLVSFLDDKSDWIIINYHQNTISSDNHYYYFFFIAISQALLQRVHSGHVYHFSCTAIKNTNLYADQKFNCRKISYLDILVEQNSTADGNESKTEVESENMTNAADILNQSALLLRPSWMDRLLIPTPVHPLSYVPIHQT